VRFACFAGLDRVAQNLGVTRWIFEFAVQFGQYLLQLLKLAIQRRSDARTLDLHFIELPLKFTVPLLSLMTLGLGLSSDLWIVVFRITQSSYAATVLSVLMLLFFYGLWFGYTCWKRREP
jgi:hypothetical protein